MQLFCEVSKTLFEKDVLLFAFMLAYTELNAELKFDIRQVEFFMKGNLTTTDIILKKDEESDDDE